MKAIQTLRAVALSLSLGVLTACGSHMEKPTATLETQPVLSVQLWSVRDAMKQDFKGTLAALSEAGFTAVEFANYYGPYKDDPQGLKDYLDSLGLQASAAHIGTPALLSDKRQFWLDYFKVLDTDLVIIPIDNRAWDPERIDDLVRDLNYLTPELAKQGFTLMYHNHEKEFREFKGETFWDYLAKNTDIGLELDAGWSNLAGVDSIDYVKRYPNRTLATHIKIRTPGSTGVNVILGQSDYDWGEYIQTLKTVGGNRWLVIEQEEYPEGMTPLETVLASKRGLEAVMKNYQK